MTEIDKKAIISGTPQKRFTIARNELAKEYTESVANDFYYEYCDKPISFILKNSRDIFSETYCGLDFYKKILSEKIINPLCYETELEKVRNFIREAEANRMPTNQLNLYKDLEALLVSLCEKNRVLIRIFKRTDSPEAFNYLNHLFDFINDCEDDAGLIAPLAGEIYNNQMDPYISIPVGYLFAKRHPECVNMLSFISRYHSTHEGDISEESNRRSFRTKECIKEMMQDPTIVRGCANFSNPNIYEEWSKLYNQPSDLTRTNVCKAPTINTSPFSEDVSVVENILECGMDKDDLAEITRYNYDVLSTKLNYYKSYYESLEEELAMGEDVEAKMESTNTIISELESQIMYLEWEADGSPNKVLKSHIMTRKDREKEEKEKNKSANGPSVSGGEFEALKAIDDASAKVSELTRTVNNKAAFTSKCSQIKKELVSEIRSDISTYPSVKEGLKKFDSNVEDYTSIFEAGEDAPPKEDIATKIQNKALDYDAKATAKDAKRSEKLQKLKNAGNALLQRPKKGKEVGDKLVKDFDTWDDNRRKEFLLKPGNRHKLFKKLKMAIMYGSAASMKLSYLPVAFAIRHMSKQKDARIRNELIAELDAEIKICEEKINDASSEGDKESKYQLMRIRDKLKSERTRVVTNSKMV